MRFPLWIIAVVIILAVALYAFIPKKPTSPAKQPTMASSLERTSAKEATPAAPSPSLPAPKETTNRAAIATIRPQNNTTSTPHPTSVRDKEEAKIVPAGIKAPEYFDNQVENLLALVSTPGTEFCTTPPRLDLTKDEILSYLKRPVEIYDDDDEETIAVKERTAAAKAEALEYIESGGTCDQYIRDMAAIATEQAEQVEDVRLEMLDILRTKGREAAEEYLATANPLLKEQGLKEVVITKIHLIQIEQERRKTNK